MTADDVFRRVVEHLERAGIPYMVTGSFASAFHGAPRATEDIDLVIAPTPQQLRALIGDLPTTQYYANVDAALDAHQHRSQFNIIDMETGWKLDLIIRKGRPFSLTEFERRTRVEMHGVRLFIATAEDVVLSKLEWAKMGHSARQLNDAASLLRVRFADLDRAYLDHWVQDLGLQNEWTEACRLAGIPV
jgi:hypothetical protein